MSTQNLQVSLDGLHWMSIHTVRLRATNPDDDTEVHVKVTRGGVETQVVNNGRLVGTNGATFDRIIKESQ